VNWCILIFVHVIEVLPDFHNIRCFKLLARQSVLYKYIVGWNGVEDKEIMGWNGAVREAERSCRGETLARIPRPRRRYSWMPFPSWRRGSGFSRSFGLLRVKTKIFWSGGVDVPASYSSWRRRLGARSGLLSGGGAVILRCAFSGKAHILVCNLGASRWALSPCFVGACRCLL
jgi:hypothetical protein